MRPPAWKIHAALFIATSIYAANYTIAKQVMPSFIEARGFILVRILGALLLLFAYHRFFIKERIRDKKDYWRLAVCAFFGVAFNMTMFFEGLSLTSPINAALIMVTTPILVLLIGFLMRTEQLSRFKVTGVLLGTLGAALLIAEKDTAVKSASMLGDIMVLLNAASYAVYLLLVRPLMQKYDPLTVILWTFTFGSIMVLPIGLEQMVEARWADLTTLLWIDVAFVVICTTFITYTFNAWSLQYVKSSVVGSYVYVQPLLGSLIAVVSGKYILHWHHIVYAALIFAGVYLVSRPVRKNAQQAVTE